MCPISILHKTKKSNPNWIAFEWEFADSNGVSRSEDTLKAQCIDILQSSQPQYKF